MYFIIVIFIIVVGYYYWDTLKSMIDIFNTTSTPSFTIINPWVIGLFFINIICFIFLMYLYQSRKNMPGIKGSMGSKGFTGYQGADCKLPCN